MRGAVAFRDDFTSSSFDTSHWDIEVSMYGGYVSFKHMYSVLNTLTVYDREQGLTEYDA